MKNSRQLSVLFSLAITCLTVTTRAHADAPHVQFDIPSVAAAYPGTVPGGVTPGGPSSPSGWKTITFELRLSCIVLGSTNSPIEQCTVRCKPRDPSLQVVDYSPKTEITSELTTPIQIKRTDEESHSVGLSLDGSYGHLARGNVGTDHGAKSIESVQFDRAAPLQAVVAAGTLDRGRGVYFKLRWTDTHVLEGERRFALTLSVPPDWRGELIDVSVVAEAEQRSLTSWQRELKPVATANFVVAAHMHDDPEATALAYQLAETEHRLRVQAMQQPNLRSPKTLPEMLRHVAMKIDVEASPVDTTWLSRLLHSQADPHVDPAIRRLPTDTRVAALEYCDARHAFRSLRSQPMGDAVMTASVLTAHSSDETE